MGDEEGYADFTHHALYTKANIISRDESPDAFKSVAKASDAMDTHFPHGLDGFTILC